MQIDEMIFDCRGPAITESAIVRIERELDVRFPQDYREFLLRHNGGLSQLCVSSDRSIGMWDWLSVDAEKEVYDLLTCNKRLRRDHGTEYLIIALDLAQSYILMRVVPPRVGAIGMLEWEVGDTIENLKLAFFSFTDFVAHLHHEPL
jgi:hypothetical protein